LGNGSVKKNPIVARQQLGKNPLIVFLGNGAVKIPLSLLGNGSVKIPVSLLGNGSVETLPRQRIDTIEELLDASFSVCHIKESRRLLLPRTSCLSDAVCV
jgi:hypothetical protein